MKEITMIGVTPEEMANLIKTQVVSEIENLLSKNEQIAQTENEFLTRKETAEFFSISLFALHDWVKKGILKPMKAGNRTYFQRSQLVELLMNSNKK